MECHGDYQKIDEDFFDISVRHAGWSLGKR
jgi:hypothetical protein